MKKMKVAVLMSCVGLLFSFVISGCGKEQCPSGQQSVKVTKVDASGKAYQQMSCVATYTPTPSASSTSTRQTQRRMTDETRPPKVFRPTTE